MPEAPLVSVLVPFYNAEQYLRYAIESVWCQDYPNLELIAVDDGSTDGSLQLARIMSASSLIPMRVETKPNGGPASALHNALSHATGEWIAWLAADDKYAPNFISRSLDVARSLPITNVVTHTNVYLMEANGIVTGIYTEVGERPPLHGDAFEARVTEEGWIAPSTILLRRDFLIRCGGFDPTFRAEDHDLLLRLTRAAHFEFIEEPLYYSRYTPGSLGKKPWLYGDDHLRALAKHKDILGDRLPELVQKVCEQISVFSFEFGNPREGLRWGIKALKATRGLRQRFIRGARLALRASRGVFRFVIISTFGHELPSKVKRALAVKLRRDVRAEAD